MKIFLTGGTGFIGSNLINELNKKNHKIFATINKSKKTAVSLTKQPVWINSSIDKIKLKDFKKIDLVIHLASHKITHLISLDRYLYWNVYAPLIMAQRAYNR